ncbi:MAG: hypothetical protein JJ866_11520 [Roseibium sp.]|uniref:hypothetical protein n=1 Tax=Roseibium sp. TaxID=1936156 RepID=UPI001B0B5E64|nr:hypothetical protein [Roseibium sp.]MBO6892560.1 hypothetical protein [Roseibium sp.]MBO6930333.1 hypothetical protein [Roseibium sp.]
MRSTNKTAVPTLAAPQGSTDAFSSLQHNCGFHIRNSICPEALFVFEHCNQHAIMCIA